MSRGATLSLYALLVLIWSSTWVAIKIGLEDAPALLGAGVRFALAGVLLLGFAAARRRPLKDRPAAGADPRPAAVRRSATASGIGASSTSRPG
jgi:drug/metabolite transporter (DMT)-like permease